MQFKDWLNTAILIITAIAIFVGPIVAVNITRKHDVAREKLRRRYEIFNKLMMTRRMILSPDHVVSLNAIQTEFHDEDTVVSAFKHYMELRAEPAPPPNAGESVHQHFTEQRVDALNELLFQIGQSLGFAFDRRDLEKYSYAPQGWANVENEQNALRRLALELLLGQRGLPVTPFQAAAATGKFPPPPSGELPSPLKQ